MDFRKRKITCCLVIENCDRNADTDLNGEWLETLGVEATEGAKARRRAVRMASVGDT